MRTSFSFVVTTSGTPAPSLTESGTLPNGVYFADNGKGTGTLSGMASLGTSGTYPITFNATNGISNDAAQSFTLNITAAASAPTITSDSSDTESLSTPFSFTIDTTGFPLPKLSRKGALPTGVKFTDNGDGTASIAGTPTTDGTFPVTITAKNTVGTVAQSFTLTITSAPVVKKIKNTKAKVGKPFSLTITAGGIPTPSLAETGILPSGLAFTDNGDGTAKLTGTPTSASTGTYTITVTGNNINGSSSQTFTLTVK